MGWKQAPGRFLLICFLMSRPCYETLSWAGGFLIAATHRPALFTGTPAFLWLSLWGSRSCLGLTLVWGDKLPGRSPAHSYVQAVTRSEDLNVPLNLKEVSVSGVPETALASGTMRSSLSSGTRRLSHRLHWGPPGSRWVPTSQRGRIS